MAELKQMDFRVFREDGRIYGMDATDHEATVKYEGDNFRIDCSCGQHWVGWSSDPDFLQKEIKGTFNSHLSYFNRPKTKAD